MYVLMKVCDLLIHVSFMILVERLKGRDGHTYSPISLSSPHFSLLFAIVNGSSHLNIDTYTYWKPLK
jgi:hypothetical protein